MSEKEKCYCANYPPKLFCSKCGEERVFDEMPWVPSALLKETERERDRLKSALKDILTIVKGSTVDYFLQRNGVDPKFLE